ncbi:MAG: hypothetical protein ACYC09_09400 [Bacteroidota bacterium]
MMWKYILAWFGMMFLAIFNGTIRDFVYKPYVGELTAHQLSTIILLILFAAYTWVLIKKMPLQSASKAWQIGGIWFVMTEIFEFGLVIKQGLSFDEMLHTYNIFDGQLWILIPLWVLVGPFLMYRFIQSYDARQEDE